MSVPVPVIWSADCLRQEPAGEVWLGVRDPGTEVPDRALVLRVALEAAGAPVQDARPHDDAILLPERRRGRGGGAARGRLAEIAIAESGAPEVRVTGRAPLREIRNGREVPYLHFRFLRHRPGPGQLDHGRPVDLLSERAFR